MKVYQRPRQVRITRNRFGLAADAKTYQFKNYFEISHPSSFIPYRSSLIFSPSVLRPRA
jgi:hypothetical protein